MPQGPHKPPARLVEAAQSIAFAVWVVAALAIPATLLLGRYEMALLVVILLVAWQFLAFAAAALVHRGRRPRVHFSHRFTHWGVVYFCVAATLCVVSVHWGLNLVYLTAAFVLGVMVCAAVLPRLTLTRTEADWSVPAHVFAGEPFPVEITLRNGKRLLSAFGLSVTTGGGNGAGQGESHHVVRLAPGREHRMALRLYMPRRGMHPLPPVAVRTAFPFDVMETTMEEHPGQDVLVLPRLGRIRQDALRRHKGGEAQWLMELRRKDPEGEFRSLREYQHGDDVRYIHWPTSARLRKLFVREFETREMRSLLLLLDAHIAAADPAAGPKRERFEKAVSFAATMAVLLTERNVFYAFASYCPELVALPYDHGQGHLYSVLEALAVAEPSPVRGLTDLAQALSFRQVSGGGICLVTPGPVSRQEAAAALGTVAQCSVCMDVSEPEFDEIFSI
jgi:uncharacterized protein (DUF58 family)